MMQSIKAVADYINNSRVALGPGDTLDRLIQTQFDQLKLLLSSAPFSVDEASVVMKALSSGSDGIDAAFSADGRKALAAVVASANAGDAVTVKPAAIKKAGTQVHMHMQHYLTKSDWSVLVDGTRIDEKIDVLVNRALKIGLTNPSELSVVAIVAIMAVASRMSLGPDEAHSLVVEYKRVNKLRRGSVAQSCASFPMSVKDFVVTHPSAYEADDPPIDCVVSTSAIEHSRLGMAARKTHKTLTSTSSSSGQNAISAGSSSCPDWMAVMANMFMQTQSKTKGGGANNGMQLSLNTPTKQTQAPMLALADVSPAQSSALVVADAASVCMADQEPCTNVLGGALNDKVDVASDKPAAAAASCLDDMVSELRLSLGQKRDASGTSKGCADGEKPKKSSAEPKAKAKPKAKAEPKAKAPAKGCAKKAKNVTPDPKPIKKGNPCIATEWSRSQVLARTGMSGPGKNFAFKFKGGQQRNGFERGAQVVGR